MIGGERNLRVVENKCFHIVLSRPHGAAPDDGDGHTPRRPHERIGRHLDERRADDGVLEEEKGSERKS